MSWNVNDEEFHAVVALPAPERYAYFIKRAASHGELWGLTDNNGWVIAADDEEAPHFPVWPHPRFASACAAGPWLNAKPTSIDIDEWVAAWLPKIRKDGLRALPSSRRPRIKGSELAPTGSRAISRTS